MAEIIMENIEELEYAAAVAEPEVEPIVESIPEPAPARKYKATTWVNMRKEPALTAAVARVINLGEKIEGKEYDGEWLDLGEGYSKKQFFEEIE